MIKRKGVEPSATYTLTFQDRAGQSKQMTGTVLMKKGLLVEGLGGKFASEIIWIH